MFKGSAQLIGVILRKIQNKQITTHITKTISLSPSIKSDVKNVRPSDAVLF